MSEFEKIVTLDGILAWFKEQIENKQPVSAEVYLDAAQKLTVLLEDTDEAIITAQSALAEAKAQSILQGKSVAQAKALSEASPYWKGIMLLKAKKERAIEFVRIAKLRSRQKEWGQM